MYFRYHRRGRRPHHRRSAADAIHLTGMAELPTGTVTFLFTDIEGSTRLLHELGDALRGRSRASTGVVLRKAFADHGGVEVDTQGDASSSRSPVRRTRSLPPRTLSARSPAGRCGFAWGSIPASRCGRTRATSGWTFTGPRASPRPVTAARCSSRKRRETSSRRSRGGPRARRSRRAPAEGPQRAAADLPARRRRPGERVPAARDARDSADQPSAPADTPDRTRAGARRRSASSSAVRRPPRSPLTGPGGAGKTRLALQAAADLLDDFADGVFFVGLRRCRRAVAGVPAIAQTLGVKESGGLSRRRLSSVSCTSGSCCSCSTTSSTSSMRRRRSTELVLKARALKAILLQQGAVAGLGRAGVSDPGARRRGRGRALPRTGGGDQAGLPAERRRDHRRRDLPPARRPTACDRAGRRAREGSLARAACSSGSSSGCRC